MLKFSQEFAAYRAGDYYKNPLTPRKFFPPIRVKIVSLNDNLPDLMT